MAYFFEAKTAGDAKTYTFAPDFPDSDAIASFSTSASGVTVAESETVDNRTIQYRLSGGTAGQTGALTVTVTTAGGDTLEYTAYVPIVASTAITADTAQSYVDFAMRKIVGIGESAEADELAHGLEVLNGLIARWRAGGADIGAAFPLISSTVIYCPDWAVSALRYNLLIECAPLFGVEPSALDYELARRGLQLVKHKNLSDVRTAEYY